MCNLASRCKASFPTGQAATWRCYWSLVMGGMEKVEGSYWSLVMGGIEKVEGSTYSSRGSNICCGTM